MIDSLASKSVEDIEGNTDDVDHSVEADHENQVSLKVGHVGL